jgi:hypothetical protein
MYALIVNETVQRYPYNRFEVASDFPNVSFSQQASDADMAAFGIVTVQPAQMPAVNRLTEKVVEQTPVKVNGAWVQQWSVVPLTPAEQQAAGAQVQQEIVAATQQRLDDFARTRNYDGILSACTYATSPTAKFAAEGQYCVGARDATWARLYGMLNEVQAGTRPAPTSFADVESELPVLTWPN